jgi:hypothetical protein
MNLLLFANNLLKQGSNDGRDYYGASCSIGFSRKIRKSITKSIQGAKIIVEEHEKLQFSTHINRVSISNSIAGKKLLDR